MQMIVLMGLALVLVFGESNAVLIQADWGVLGLAIGGYWAVTAALTATATWLGLRRLRGGPSSIQLANMRFGRVQLATQIWLLGGLAGLLGLGLLPQLASLWPISSIPVVQSGRVRVIQEALALAIFLVAILLCWLVAFKFDKAMRTHVEQELLLAGRLVRPGWNLRQYLDFHLRHNFLFIAVPVGLIILALDLINLMYLPHHWEWLQQVLAAGVIGVVFLISPMLLVHVWRTRPMSDGQLRRRLERLCSRVGLRYRQLRIWDTAGVVANAGVMGLHRTLRYVLVTDALLENMDDEQIVAVFGHEAGHVKHHHLGYFLVFTIAASAISRIALAGIMALLPASWSQGRSDTVETIILLIILAPIWGIGFGWLSRRFERQADVYGAWCSGTDCADVVGARVDDPYPDPAGDPSGQSSCGAFANGSATFIMALENVARLNGMSRHTRNWRHGSIASRVDFLRNWARPARTARLSTGG